MDILTNLLFQGIYINPQQILILIIVFLIVFSIIFGAILAYGKDKIDNNLD